MAIRFFDMFAGIGGFVFASKYGQVMTVAGNGYEMTAIAACVLGGISLSGGLGNMVGAAIGAVIMSSISRLLVFIGLPSTYDNTITGIMLIVIVVVDALTQRRSIEMARRKLSVVSGIGLPSSLSEIHLCQICRRLCGVFAGVPAGVSGSGVRGLWRGESQVPASAVHHEQHRQLHQRLHHRPVCHAGDDHRRH